jgi:hypothetical protein
VPRPTSHGESVASSSSVHDSTRSRQPLQDGTLSPQNRDSKQLLPGFKDSSAQTLRERQQNHDNLFRSLRGDYRPTTTNEEIIDNQSIVDFETAANDPFMPPHLMAAIQTSMKNCAEYERQCAQLEVSSPTAYFSVHGIYILTVA